MPQLKVRSKMLGYEAQPSDFNTNELTVVFIHGSGGDRENWRGQLDQMDDTATMLALELPGHGTSDPPGETTVDVYAQWVVDFVETLRLIKVVLVGCSLGSAVTQWIALLDKPWLKGIGLAGAGARLKVHPAFLEGIYQDRAKAMQAFADFAVSSSADETFRNRLAEEFMACPPELLHGDLTACNNFDVMEKIKEINIPTCILVGEDDKLTPVKYSQFLHDNIPSSTLNIISGAGHVVMMEKPEEFNRLLRDFLKNLAC